MPGRNWAIKTNLTNATQIPNYLDYTNTSALQDIKPGAITVIK